MKHSQNTPDLTWHTRFLAELRRTGVVTMSAEAAGIAVSTVYKHREENQDFADLMALAREEAIDRIEARAFEMAADGYEEVTREVDANGNVTVTKRVSKVSETMQKFLLTALRYKRMAPGSTATTFVQNNTALGVNVQDVRSMAPESVEEIRSVLRRELDRIASAREETARN